MLVALEGLSIETQPMLKPAVSPPTPEQALLAKNFGQALAESKVPPKAIAELCDITEQAVSNWKRTGKIARQHLPKIAMATGWSVTRLLTGLADATSAGPVLSTEEAAMISHFRDMPAEDQAELAGEIHARAQKSREHVARILRERFGITGMADAANVNRAIPPLPTHEKTSAEKA